MRFSTKYSKKGYFNSKINMSKLVVPSAGTGCLTGCRNLLELMSKMCCPAGKEGHGRKVPVGLWKENGRECVAGNQSSLMLQRALWKEKSQYEVDDNP